MAKDRHDSTGSSVIRSQNILVRVNDAEKEGFRAAADLAGIPLSAWIRERLRKAAISELATANKQVAFLEAHRPNEE
jgi:hypothetical protein